MAKNPVRVAVTGAAGNIGYALVFRIAAGDMLGPDQPVILQMLEITPALDALKGVGMELDDCAFPLLAGMVQTDDPNEAFGDVDYALLVGSRPRSKGMERADLLEANGAIFTAQGKALSDSAGTDVKVLVVGNPANTNCLIAMNNAPDVDPRRFTAMTRLDHNRAASQIAAKAGVHSTDVTKVTIWGNHSATQYPDIFHAEVKGKPAADAIGDTSWIEKDFIPTVQQRGAAIIEARGSSSAASAANAAIDHVRDWALGTPKADGEAGGKIIDGEAGGKIIDGEAGGKIIDWVSMAVPSDGSYGVPEGLISGYPCTASGGDWSIVPGLDLDDFSRERIDRSVAELVEERDTVAGLGLLG